MIVMKVSNETESKVFLYCFETFKICVGEASLLDSGKLKQQNKGSQREREKRPGFCAYDAPSLESEC